MDVEIEKKHVQAICGCPTQYLVFLNQTDHNRNHKDPDQIGLWTGLPVPAKTYVNNMTHCQNCECQYKPGYQAATKRVNDYNSIYDHGINEV